MMFLDWRRWLDPFCGRWRTYFGDGNWSFPMPKSEAFKMMRAFNCEYIEKVRGWGVGARVYNTRCKPPDQDPFNPRRKPSVRKQRKEFSW